MPRIVDCEILRLVTRHHLSQMELAVFRECEVSSYLEHELRRLVVQIEARLTAKKHVDRYNTQHTIKVPQDWWQHFKDRWFPAWAKNRWPVLCREITIATHHEVTYNTCPHMSTKKTDYHVHFLLNEEYPHADSRTSGPRPGEEAGPEYDPCPETE